MLEMITLLLLVIISIMLIGKERFITLFKKASSVLGDMLLWVIGWGILIGIIIGIIAGTKYIWDEVITDNGEIERKERWERHLMWEHTRDGHEHRIGFKADLERAIINARKSDLTEAPEDLKTLEDMLEEHGKHMGETTHERLL